MIGWPYMNKRGILVLNNLRSVENVGSIFRTAEALGIEKLILIGTTPTPLDRFGRKRKDLAKVALGAEDFLSWEYYKEVTYCPINLRKEGYQILALEQSKNSVSISSFTPTNKFALILGNEVEGIEKEVLEQCDQVLEIPMQGKKESLNVSVAAGIALFELLK
jgi:23S rRNA (guanosine2251-2'-O)-methyltransferase